MAQEALQTIYTARSVRTMDPGRPLADAVMVRGDRIRAVGSLEELASYGPAVIDRRYEDRVIFPGFVEAHSHLHSGGMWENVYVGYFDRMDPRGDIWRGCTSIEAVLQRLRESNEALSASSEPLVGWGLDPIYFPGKTLDRHLLDQVSSSRPIVLLHQSGHLATVNSALMELDGITRSTMVEGVVKDAHGLPTGELREPTAMSLVASVPTIVRTAFSSAALTNFGADARNHGVTTATDLGNQHLLDPMLIEEHRKVMESDRYPVRVSLFHFGAGLNAASDVDDEAEQIARLRRRSGAKLHFGNVKLFLDGSIQGFTARLCEPGYLDSAREGISLLSQDEFYVAFRAYHRSGATIHVHCNGDEATEVCLDTVERVLAEYPRWDHRHTVTHSQLTTPAQYRRMAALGVCANIFSNHIWYWGDQHRDITLGEDRASRMNAAATALRSGVPISLHSDTPVTPLDPLATASYAAERRTASGQVLGRDERISVSQALHAVTLGSAYMLKLDHLVGSLEAGKFADFAILGTDPMGVQSGELRDIEVYGTVVGGVHFPIARGA